MVYSTALPEYDDLPSAPGAPPGSSWHLWGREDVFGTLNLLSAEGVQRGLADATDGCAFSMNLDLTTPTPSLIGRELPVHHYAPIGRYGADDVIDRLNTQLSTQWDGFGHVAHPIHGHYNGLARTAHGVHHWARRGICGRGVLADVGSWRALGGRELKMDSGDIITAADLAATLDWQRTTVARGDVLLLRTGWVGWYKSLSSVERRAVDNKPCSSPGFEQSEATCRALWNLHISAAAADNTSFEAAPFRQIAGAPSTVLTDPSKVAEYTLMYNLLSLLGLPFGELFDLDSLAEHCRRTGKWSFLFVSAPMNLAGGVGSPANALAIT